MRACSVTASAMAVSRQRFRMWNSAVGDRRVLLDGQLRDRLADVAVIVNDLRHCETQGQQVSPVAGRAVADRRCENGVSVFSSRSVSASWVRNIGTPCSSSSLDAGGHGRVLTLTLVLAMIASRYVVKNSYSIGPFSTTSRCFGAGSKQCRSSCCTSTVLFWASGLSTARRYYRQPLLSETAVLPVISRSASAICTKQHSRLSAKRDNIGNGHPFAPR